MSWKRRKRMSVCLLVLVLLLLLLNCDRRSVALRDDLIVNTNSGRIHGVRHYFPVGKAVDVYLGIPFAKPPIGSLRFKHPQPIDPWKEIFNATQLPNSCYQVPDTTFGPDFHGSNMWNPTTRVSEDCLYLNIWVPKIQQARTKKAAVMIWIFGGGFYSGTTTLNLYDGKILAAENNVIVVSIGYRVGAFGYFFLNSPAAPANAGMFDQLMALDWIQQNIRAFGGDPNNITLFGESAGAASVSLHLLSPLSHSKFQRAILQSGTANMPWAAVTMAEAKRRSLELALEVIGCPASDDMDVVADCMRKESPKSLAETQYITPYTMQFPFLPVIDGNFLTDSPDELLRQGAFKKCPILLGSNLNEGSYFLIYALYELLTLESFNMSRGQFVTSMKDVFYYYPQYKQEISPAAMEAILFQYTNWADPDNDHENVLALDRAVGDGHFVCPLNHFAHIYATAGEGVYMYYLTQRYESNPWPPWMGVLHGDDIVFVFGEALKPGRNYSQGDKDLSRMMMTYWTNFAKTGDPNQIPGLENLGHWPLHDPLTKEYLELNSRFLNDPSRSGAIRRGPRIRECAFWDHYLPRLLINGTAESPSIGHSHHQLNHCHGNGAAVRGSIFLPTLAAVFTVFQFLQIT